MRNLKEVPPGLHRSRARCSPHVEATRERAVHLSAPDLELQRPSPSSTQAVERVSMGRCASVYQLPGSPGVLCVHPANTSRFIRKRVRLPGSSSTTEACHRGLPHLPATLEQGSALAAGDNWGMNRQIKACSLSLHWFVLNKQKCRGLCCGIMG